MGRSQPADSAGDGAANWGSFPETVLHFNSDPPLVIDLRCSVDAASRSQLRLIGFERSFGIVTAQNPMGVVQPEDMNAVLAASLQTEIADLSVPHVCLDACSPDRSHCERSVAIALDLQSLVSLARRYDQLAVFWFDGESFWIVPVHSRNIRVRLPARI